MFIFLLNNADLAVFFVQLDLMNSICGSGSPATTRLLNTASSCTLLRRISE